MSRTQYLHPDFESALFTSQNNPNYVFSRRASGTRSKKSKMLQAMASKTSTRRAGSQPVHGNQSHPRDSDDSPFTPEGYASSASSTSSFYYPRQDYSPINQYTHRPGTSASQASSSNQSDCFIATNTSQSAVQSRQGTPALSQLSRSQSNRSTPLHFDPRISDSTGQRVSSSSTSPSLQYSNEWPYSVPPYVTASVGQTPYSAPSFPPTNWSDQSSSSLSEGLLVSSPKEDMPPPSRQLQHQRPMHARQHSQGSEGIHADTSSSSPVQARYASGMPSSSSMAGPDTTRYQPLPSLPTFSSRPHTVPSPRPVEWNRMTVFSHRTMPAMHPASPAHGARETSAAPQAIPSTSEQETAPTQATLPVWLSSSSDVDMSVL